MKLGILHHDLEWPEKEFKKYFLDRGLDVELFDIRSTNTEKILNANVDIIFNRVYASVANRDYKSTQKALKLYAELEELGIRVINASNTTVRSGYDKYFAYQAMIKEKVNTPNTLLLNGHDPKEELNQLGFPLIVKKNTGARGDCVFKVDNLEEAYSAITKIKSLEDYDGEILLQEFVTPVEPNDYRVAVLNGKVLFVHGRSLISLKAGEEPWLASRSSGSKLIKIDEVSEELKSFAIKGAKCIDSYFDVLDIVKTENGYCIIEHNLTPLFTPQYLEFLGFNPIEVISEEIVKNECIPNLCRAQ
ncbi:ATP-grasp domain-containing protein [archaeon]|jgi:RimK family alpha-L-glutamate ligase|nr:ATP-grasp domain-containing protein [archaeon]MBT4397236.1 ATP-grasp domain-containing protein [archaeon]MBT4440616.1 ATP-grasp domain-containing protein [archaeon]